MLNYKYVTCCWCAEPFVASGDDEMCAGCRVKSEDTDMQYDSVKDSGVRQEFDTGAVRDTQHGKGRPDLLSPYSLMRLARHFENGANKYDARNWEKGIPLARYMESIFRHWCAYLAGDRSEDHLAAIEWNAHCMIQTEQWIREGRLPASLDTLPNGGMNGCKEG